MNSKTGFIKRFIQDFYLVIIMVFLYAPIATMAVLSFNSSKSRTSGAALPQDGIQSCSQAAPL